MGSLAFGFNLSVINGPLEQMALDLGIAGNKAMMGLVGGGGLGVGGDNVQLNPVQHKALTLYNVQLCRWTFINGSPKTAARHHH